MLGTAISCVKALQKETISDQKLFEHAANTSLASAMSLISNIAQYIESSVNSSPAFWDIESLVIFRVKKRSNPEQHLIPENFVLWNTLSSSNYRNISRNTQSQRGRREIRTGNVIKSAANQDLPSISTPSPHRGGENETVPLPNGRNLGRPEENALLQPSNGQPMFASPQEKQYVVPVSIAAECLRLLLDASGFTSHRTSFQQSSYTTLGAKVLEEALRKVFEREKDRRLPKGTEDREQNNGNLSTCRTEKQTEQSGLKPQSARSSKPDMIYQDLLPDHLRPTDEKDVFCSVPEVKFAFRGQPIVSKMMKVCLKIRKPDRNKKSQNFAALCTILHFTGDEGACAKFLREYAKEGLSVTGCTRRMKYCASRGAKCGGFTNCVYLKRTLCSFSVNCGTTVGKGTVDPFLKQVNGMMVEKGRIAVRFGVVTVEKEKIDFNDDDQGLNGNVEEWASQPIVWLKSLISRVQLCSGFGSIVASAILVEDHIPGGIQGTLVKNIPKKLRGNEGLDVTRAIIVCDIQIIGNKSDGLRYPYAEWYNLQSLKHLKQQHFESGRVPDVLTERDASQVTAILWHKNMCKTN